MTLPAEKSADDTTPAARGDPSLIFEARDVTKVYPMGEVDVHALRGLEEGDLVVVHPSDKIVDGIAVRQR